MKRFFPVLTVLGLASLTVFADVPPPDTTKKCFAMYASMAPKIDGLVDPVWLEAPAQSDFVMSRPIENGVPTQRTEFRILYDNTALYLLAVMSDTAPDSILRELGLRDARDPNSGAVATDINADQVRFVIDPYNTRQDAYDFGVYASGVQADSKFSDYTWDGVWESAVGQNGQGWVAELKIPYSAIRFPKKDVQAWAFQVTRNIRRHREFDQWCLTPSEAYNSQLYWGTLNCLENIDPPPRLSLTPYVSGYIERSPVYNADNTYSYNNGFSYNVGADLKYGIDERFTLDMTLFPDFGQTQSDNKIKTLGYEEINYDENRYFFKEGTDLFSKAGLFYTRRIGKIPSGFFDVENTLQDGESVRENPAQVKLLNATKISGRTGGGTGIGFFNAVTDNTYAEVEDASGNVRRILTEPLTNYNVVVLDQQIGNSSNAYLINTNVIRTKDYDDANVTGVGTTLTTKKNTYATDLVFNLSQQFTKEGQPENSVFTNTLGHRYFAGLRKISGRFQAGMSRNVYSDTYDQLDMGYYVTNNRERNRVYAEYYQFQPSKLLREGSIGISSDYVTDYINKERTNFSVDTWGWCNLLSYNALFGGAGFTPVTSRDYDPRLDGRYVTSHRYWYVYFGVSTDYRKRFAVDLTQNISNFIDDLVSEGYNTDLSLRFRVNDKFTLNMTSGYHFDPYNFGYVTTTPETPVYGARRLTTHVNRLAARYIFQTDLSVSVAARHYWLTGQYRRFYSLDDDGDYIDYPDYSGDHDFSYNAFNIDLLFTWRFAPGSSMSISYKNAIEYDGPFETRQFAKNLKDTWDLPQTNSFSVKVLYYLDYLYIVRR